MEGVTLHEHEVEFFCTNRGKHKIRRLGKVVKRDKLNEQLATLASGFGFERMEAGPDIESLNVQNRRHNGEIVRVQKFTAIDVKKVRKGNLWIIKCPTCRTELRKHEPVIARLLDYVVSTGNNDMLDISHAK